VRTNFSALEATVRADRAAIDNAQAAALAAEATIDNARAAGKANEAMVDAARLQLAYTAIRAPMDGRTGNLLVQAGNVVKTGEDTPLVVIAQVHPIYVSFSVPEQHLTRQVPSRGAGSCVIDAAGAPPGHSRSQPHGGPGTGTIQLRRPFRTPTTRCDQFIDVA
jgi:multidrug efflux system membrane fusion protein